MLGARVRRTDAESLRKELTTVGLVDISHAILEERGSVIIPLRDRPEEYQMKRYSAEVVDMEFPARQSLRDPIDDIRDSAKIPPCLKHLLPSKWELFGDVVVIKLDRALDEFEKDIAEAYASALRAKTVLRDVGGISGELRRPVVKKLLGTDTVTVHKENGIRYKFDVSEIMFSSGNMEERLRMAELRCDGETIVDMFAGIGYFSLPMAVYQKPKRILACELNPVAHGYLVENIRLNEVGTVVKPILGDNRELPDEHLADRVIMGYVKTTHEYLPAALKLLKSGGILHYHETCPNELLPARPIQRLVDSVEGGEVSVLRFRKIKSYAPGVSHVVVDARIVKPS